MSLEDLVGELDRRLADADAALAADYPGDRGVRQPVHTVYVPADKYDVNTVGTWGAEATAVLSEYGGSAEVLADVLELPPGLMGEVFERVRAKLAREPIEDLRIDFEDGYGTRSDEEEDAAAFAAARALTRSVRAGASADGASAVAPYHGLRIKSLEAPTRRRGVRTLDLFVRELTAAGGLTDGFVVTLPKVTSVEQVEAMVVVLEALEVEYGASELKFEIQVETPQAILGSDGTALIARMIKAGAGRVTGLHYGTYDYSASLGVAAAYQSMEHPVADHAKDVMQLAAAGTGVFVSDGSTNVLPIGDAVHAAWRLTIGWYDAHSRAASTRAGTCTRLSCRLASSRRISSIARVWRQPPPGCARTSARASPATSTSRQPPRPWRASSCAASTAARWTRRRSTSSSASTSRDSRSWPVARCDRSASLTRCDWLRSSPPNPSTSKERHPLTPPRLCERRRKPVWSATSARWAHRSAASRSCSCPRCPTCWRPPSRAARAR